MIHGLFIVASRTWGTDGATRSLTTTCFRPCLLVACSPLRSLPGLGLRRKARRRRCCPLGPSSPLRPCLPATGVATARVSRKSSGTTNSSLIEASHFFCSFQAVLRFESCSGWGEQSCRLLGFTMPSLTLAMSSVRKPAAFHLGLRPLSDRSSICKATLRQLSSVT